MKNIIIKDKSYLFATVSILLWSTSATVSKLLLNSLNSMQVLVISSFFSFSFLLTVNIINGNIKHLREYKINDYIQIFGIGILGTFLYNLFYYLGIKKMQASQAFIINYLWPIMTVVFACIILKEKITIKKIIAILLSFLGVVIVTGNGNFFNIDRNTLIGALYCFLAATSYGLFSVLNKKKNYNNFLRMMLFYFFTFIISLLYVLISKETFVPQISQLIGLMWIGIFTSAIGFTSWVMALEKGDTAKISNLAYITPFLSLIWIALILKEKISIFSIIGLIVIVLGIIIQLKDKR